MACSCSRSWGVVASATACVWTKSCGEHPRPGNTPGIAGFTNSVAGSDCGGSSPTVERGAPQALQVSTPRRKVGGWGQPQRGHDTTCPLCASVCGASGVSGFSSPDTPHTPDTFKCVLERYVTGQAPLPMGDLVHLVPDLGCNDPCLFTAALDGSPNETGFLGQALDLRGGCGSVCQDVAQEVDDLIFFLASPAQQLVGGLSDSLIQPGDDGDLGVVCGRPDLVRHPLTV